jgi:hypothetical protein
MKIAAKILFGLIFLLPFATFGQEASTSETKKSSVEGTYQFEVIGRAQPMIPNNLEKIVAENRHKTKVTYVPYGTNVRIKILPENEIKAPSFKPVAEVVHVSLFENKK